MHFAVTTKARITVNIEAAHYEHLRRLASEHKVSMAWLARQAIGYFLEASKSDPEFAFHANLNRDTATVVGSGATSGTTPS